MNLEMKNIQKHNFFLFSGGPGAGKTAVIEHLKQRGTIVVPEVARSIIKHQQTIGGNATHNGDRLLYTDMMLEKSINDFESLISVEKNVYFDRGLPDLYSYSSRFCNGVTQNIQNAIERYRYNSLTFIFPPWQEIYCHDNERTQHFEEAIETWNAINSGYKACGYQTIEIPKMSIEERADFILKITHSGE